MIAPEDEDEGVRSIQRYCNILQVKNTCNDNNNIAKSPLAQLPVIRQAT